MASIPTLKEPTDVVAGGAAKWGGPDASHAAELIKGTHSTEKIQPAAIDGLELVYSGYKKPVRAASTADIDLGSASDPSPVDGVTLADGDRILLKDQTAGLENGIYDCVDADDPTTWVRSNDFAVSADITSGLIVLVSEGTAAADKIYILTTNGALTLDTTALVFAALSGGGGGGMDDLVDDLSPTLGGDLVAAGFDINDLSNLEFRTTTGVPGPTVPAIYKEATRMTLNVPTSSTFEFTINDAIQNIISTTTFRINQALIDLQSGCSIEWATGRNIINDAGGFEYNVAAGDTYEYFIDAVSEYVFSATEIDLKANKITNFGNLEQTGVRAVAGAIKLVNNNSIAWRNAGNSADKFFRLDSNDQFICDGAPLKLNNLINGLDTITSTATLVLDFDDEDMATINTLAHAPTITTSNRAVGKKKRILIVTDGTNRALTFSESWKWLTAIPTTTNANKNGMLTLECFGSAATDVVAAWTEQP